MVTFFGEGPFQVDDGTLASTLQLPAKIVELYAFDDDAGNWRRVTQRVASADAGFASTIRGTLVNSRPAALDTEDGEYTRVRATSAPTSTEANEASSLNVTQARESAFAAARNGRRFVATHQTPGTLVTAQTGFVATTPTFLMRQSSSSVRIILRSITLTQMGTVAGGPIFIVGMLDPDDRLSAGGTAVVPKNTNLESAGASGLTEFLFNPTATAADADERVVVSAGAPATVGTITQIGFRDQVLVPLDGSFLLYTWAPGTAPSWLFTFEWEEVAD